MGPNYKPLSASPNSRRHVIVIDRHGVEPARRLSSELDRSGDTGELLTLSEQEDGLPRSRKARETFDSLDRLRSRLDALLRGAPMGTMLYIAGPESFIWAVNTIAVRRGLGDSEIQREACGPRIRPVFCAHCRALIEEVSASRVSCPGCGRSLEVREHFSTRLGAYLGVCSVASTSKASVD